MKPSSTSDNNLGQALSYIATKIRVKFSGSCLQQDKILFTHEKIVTISIIHEIRFSDSNNNYPALEYFCLVQLN